MKASITPLGKNFLIAILLGLFANSRMFAVHRLVCKEDISSSFVYFKNGLPFYYMQQFPIEEYYTLTIDSAHWQPYMLYLTGMGLGTMVYVNESLWFVAQQNADSIILDPIRMKLFNGKGVCSLSILSDRLNRRAWKCCLADTAYVADVNTEWKPIQKASVPFYEAKVISIWILFLLVGLVWVSDRSLFFQALWPAGFLTSTYAAELAARRNLTDSSTLFQLVGLLILLTIWSFLIAFPTSNEGARQLLEQVSGYPGYIGGLILFQLCTIPLFASLFNLGSLGRIHAIIGLRLNVALLSLLTLVWILIYIRIPAQDFMHIDLPTWIILFYAGLRGTNILLSLSKVTSLFDLGFFSYLCTTEFLPLLVLISIL